jgi:hypothetical protein
MRCNNCGLEGAESTGHRCPALTTPCRLCGSPDGGSTGHICHARLAWPIAIRDQSGTAGAFAPRLVLVPVILLSKLTRWP